MTVHHTGGEPPRDQPYRGAPLKAAFLRFWKKGFTFSGRASASEYWKAYLANVLAMMAVYVIGLTLTLVGGLVHSLTWLMWIGVAVFALTVLYALAAFVPAIAVAVRRLHDTNQPGVMYLLSFIPAVGPIILIVMLCQDANPQGARFDEPGAQPRPGIAPAPPRPASLAAPAPGAVPPASRPVGSASPAFGGPPAPPPIEDLDERTFIPGPAAPVTGAYVGRAEAPAAPITAVPGMAPPAPPVPPAPPAAADLDSTLLSAAAVASGWVIALADGRSIPVSGAPVYLGRSPIAAPEHPNAVLVPIDDPAKSMSKTHARIAVSGVALEVTDLHSTNGTRIEAQGAPAIAVSPAVAHFVPAGSSIVLGDYVVTVRRA